jgi:acyl carrier protein
MTSVSDIRGIAVAALLSGISAEPVDDATPLGDGGLAINSLALLRAFIALEDRLGIIIDDAAVASAKFETVGDFVAVIDRAYGRRGSAGEQRL